MKVLPRSPSSYLFAIAGVICFLFLSPLAAIDELRSRNFSNILIFSEKLSEASFFRICALVKIASKIPALELFPF